MAKAPVFAPDSVTTINNAAEVDPRDAGLTKEDIDTIWKSVQRFYKTGLHPALTLCIRRHGKVVMDRAIGYTHGAGPKEKHGERRLATPGSLFNIFSASKAITAMLIHLLNERNLVNLDDPIAEYIPEFAQHGKAEITIRHLLTHRAGIPTLPEDVLDLNYLQNDEKVLELICAMEPQTYPGRRLAYHAITGGFIFAEIIRRTTGKPIRQFMHEEILAPLGFKHMNYGVRPDEVNLVAKHYVTGAPVVPPASWILKQALGMNIHGINDVSNDPRFLTAVVPSGNIIATANEVSRFYQILLNGGELDGVRIFEERTIRRAISEQSFFEFDFIINMPLRYGMGFLLGGRFGSPYGYDTERAFGHVGFTNVIAYADPDRDISVCLMNNGKPLVTTGVVQWFKVMWTIARVIPKTI